MTALTSQRIDHVAIVVRDADATVAWYGGTFGMQVVHDEIDPFGVRMVFLAPAADTHGTAIQVLAPGTEGMIAEYLADFGEGLHHVCLAVPDIEAALAAVGDEQAVPFVGGKGRLCAFPLHVPGNVRLELVEEPPAALEPDAPAGRTDHVG